MSEFSVELVQKIQQAGHTFSLHWCNDQDLYLAVLRYSRELRRRVPGMTPETLGHNVREKVRTWCHSSLEALPGIPAGLPLWGEVEQPAEVSRDVLRQMSSEMVGLWNYVDGDAVGEEILDVLREEEN